MKKILMLGALIVSASVFAADPAPNPHAAHQAAGQSGMMMGSQGGMMNGQMGAMMTPEMKQKMADMGMSCPMMENGMMENMTPEMKQKMEKDMALMHEKMAEAKKLSTAEKPDWKKIEKLNGEIGAMRAKHMTEMMKMNHEMMKKPAAPKTN